MPQTANIQYFSAPGQPFEVILCENSTISYPLHNHVSVYTVGLVLQGAFFLGIGNSSSICRPGRAFVIPPYRPHFIKAHSPYSLLSLCIAKQEICQPPEFWQRLLADLNLSSAQQRQLLNCLNSLNRIDYQPAANPAIYQAQKQLEKCPENTLHIEELAQAAYLSKYHFIRCFKRAVGLTPHQFQIQNRIRKGQQLLRKSESITKVALLTGFYDQSHFNRHFTKILGLTPSRYQQACQTLPKKLRP